MKRGTVRRGSALGVVAALVSGCVAVAGLDGYSVEACADGACDEQRAVEGGTGTTPPPPPPPRPPSDAGASADADATGGGLDACAPDAGFLCNGRCVDSCRDDCEGAPLTCRENRRCLPSEGCAECPDKPQECWRCSGGTNVAFAECIGGGATCLGEGTACLCGITGTAKCPGTGNLVCVFGFCTPCVDEETTNGKACASGATCTAGTCR